MFLELSESESGFIHEKYPGASNKALPSLNLVFVIGFAELSFLEVKIAPVFLSKSPRRLFPPYCAVTNT